MTSRWESLLLTLNAWGHVVYENLNVAESILLIWSTHTAHNEKQFLWALLQHTLSSWICRDDKLTQSRPNSKTGKQYDSNWYTLTGSETCIQCALRALTAATYFWLTVTRQTDNERLDMTVIPRYFSWSSLSVQSKSLHLS